MSRQSQIQTHPQREAIERALIDGTPILRISATYGVQRDALYRYANHHLGPSIRQRLRGEDRARTSDLIGRLFEIAEDHRRSRVALQDSGHVGGAVRAGDAELRALVALIDRLGIDDTDVLAILDDADALAKAVGQLARSNPAAGAQLVTNLHDLGATTLADALNQITNTNQEIAP